MFKYLAVLGMLCISVNAQQPRRETSQVARPVVSLELGSVTVWLGMPQTDALLKLQAAGYQVVGASAESIRMVIDGKTTYTVAFGNGRLIFASRDWYTQGTGEMTAVLGALAALAAHSTTSCSVTHAPITKPDEVDDRVFIECGQRSVLLAQGHFGSSTNTFVSAYERIGQLE